MAFKLGEAFVEFNSRGLKGVVSAAHRAMGGLRKLSGVAGIATGAVSALGTAGLGLAVFKKMEGLDEIAKFAARTGMAAEEVSALAFAAEQTGTSQQTMLKGLERLARTAGEAQAGVGTATDAFNMLGISAEGLAGVPVAETLRNVAEAIAGIEDPTQQAAAAYDIFGRSGQDLLNFLNEGRAGINAFVAEAEELGLGFDAEELAGVEAANDAINRVKKTVGGLIGELAVGLAPVIESVAGTAQAAFRAMSGDAGGAFAGIVDTMVTGLAVGEFAFQNLADIGRYAFSVVAHGAVRFGNEIAYFFTEVIPKSLSWFAENWQDIWWSAFELVETVFDNLKDNVVQNMTEIWEYISSGGTRELEFAWKPLTDGYVSSIKSLPNITPRVIGALEETLQEDAERLGTKLGTSLAAKMAEAQQRGQKAAEGLERGEQRGQYEVPQEGPDGASGGRSAGGLHSLKSFADNLQQSILNRNAQEVAKKNAASNKKSAEALQEIKESMSRITLGPATML